MCCKNSEKTCIYVQKHKKKEVLMRIFSINMHNRTFAFLDF